VTRVLIVDDKANNRYLLRMLLQGHGFAVDATQHGGEALAKAQENAPDLVISDLLMPEMDGYELLRRWRADERFRAIPFIVYTATYTEPKDEELALQLGADAFIIKPTEPEPFMERVREVLDRASPGARPAASPGGEDGATLKLYNEVLVGKLEHKCKQLEERVAELIRSEAHVIRMSRCHNARSDISQAIVHTRDRGALLQSVCRIAVERGGFAVAWIGMLDAATADVVPVASYGTDRTPALLRALNERGPWRTPAEIASSQGHLYSCNDLQADPALAPIHQHLLEAGLWAATSCPLRVGEHVVGALTVFASEKYPFGQTLRDFVTDTATEVSFALENFEHEEVRAHAEEELRRLNSDLENLVQARTAALTIANKELEAFSFSVSHDLRAPLVAITGFARAVMERNEGKLDPSSLSLLTKVHAGAVRMELLIHDLLDLARVSRKEMRNCDFDLSESALNVIDALRQSQPGRSVRVMVSPGMTVHADPGLIRIVLENLIGNAWKFTSRTADPLIEVGLDAGTNSYFVRDNGAGFDMEYAHKLFTPFQRLHGAGEFQGSGIGLSIVHRIVTRHRGRVWCEASPGKGATFRFTLPADRAGTTQRPLMDIAA
jgi:signal transduction histidine kinase/DNA-binding response OmpR family regulator